MRRLAGSLSDRRLATVVSLLLLSVFCAALVYARILATGSLHYRFLLWNLFLAWIPFLAAMVVYDGHRRRLPRALLLVPAAVWLLFLPNAPYILTDFVHLGFDPVAPLWFDLVILASAAWTGLLLGLISLFLVHSVARRALGPVVAWLGVLAALGLASFGVYLGRFVRWNSWDVVVQPWAIAAQLRDGLADPLAYPRMLAVTVVLAGFLALAYVLLYNVAHLREGEAERS